MFGIEETILNHHAGAKRFVWYLVIEPEYKLADIQRVDIVGVLLVILPSGCENIFARFWNIVNDVVVQFVVDADWNLSNHVQAELFGVWRSPMSSLEEQMVSIRASNACRPVVSISFLPLLLLCHDNTPLFGKCECARLCPRFRSSRTHRTGAEAKARAFVGD